MTLKKVNSSLCSFFVQFTSVRMSAGTPVAMRMVHNCCRRPHWYMDFWQLDVAPGELTGDTITLTSWEKKELINQLGWRFNNSNRHYDTAPSPYDSTPPYLEHEMEVGDLLCRPARVIVTHLKPRLHSLDVRALLEEILIGAVVL